MTTVAIEGERAIRGWRLTACREVVGISSVAKLADLIRDYAETKGDPAPRGFSARTLNDIEAGRATLSPQAADYIAIAVGVSTTFFTAPPERLGDILADESAIARPSQVTPYARIMLAAGDSATLAEAGLAALESANRDGLPDSTPAGRQSPRTPPA